MIHYSCDRCKRPIDPENDLRYLVRLEVEAVMDPLHDEQCPGDRDHLLEIDEILERADADQSPEIGDDVYQKRRFDLCPTCFRKFIQNPVGREKKVTLGFSQN
jgi:hypothetical protein